MFSTVYQLLFDSVKAGNKLLAVLIDPDNDSQLPNQIAQCNAHSVDLIFLGGSLIHEGDIGKTIAYIKAHSNIPVVLFPGDTFQIHADADALLLLSLISGRNADLLIGKHVIAAPYLKKSGLETIATGYMLIDGGRPTTASYISNSLPIPNDKPEIAAGTAMAGEMLGLKLIYLDSGSGALMPVSPAMINKVKENITLPLIVGGGIKTAQQALEAWHAGADIVVVGNAVEKNPAFIQELTQYKINTPLEV
jgi:putative glycerol-1-phosphate prenyltransferase